MDIRALQLKDYIWHGPTGKRGFIEDIEDTGDYLRVQLDDGEGPHLITSDGFRLWWAVERDEVQIHWPTGDIGELIRSGNVRELPL